MEAASAASERRRRRKHVLGNCERTLCVVLEKCILKGLRGEEVVKTTSLHFKIAFCARSFVHSPSLPKRKKKKDANGWEKMNFIIAIARIKRTKKKRGTRRRRRSINCVEWETKGEKLQLLNDRSKPGSDERAFLHLWLMIAHQHSQRCLCKIPKSWT